MSDYVKPRKRVVYYRRTLAEDKLEDEQNRLAEDGWEVDDPELVDVSDMVVPPKDSESQRMFVQTASRWVCACANCQRPKRRRKAGE